MPDRKSADAKLTALKEQSTLNPRPQDVTVPLFADSPFFDPRDLVQVKYEMLRSAQVDGKPVAHCAAAFGLSRPSFDQARAVLAEAGLGGLVPRKRGPRSAHKLTEEVMAFVEEERRAAAESQPTELARKVLERFGIVVHPRSIERALGRRGKKA